MRLGELQLRRGLLLLAAAGALSAVLGGLARLGLGTDWGDARAVDHGPLFVLGVFGTVIALERAVALGASWGRAAPLLGAMTALALLLGLRELGPPLAGASAVALVAVNAAVVRRQAVAFTWLMLLGSGLLLVGNVAWLVGVPVQLVVCGWMGFFVLTILAERLELSRLAPKPPWATSTLWLTSIALTAAVGLALADAPLGPRLLGVCFAVLALWEVRFDIARRLLGVGGLPRYAAVGVLAGAGWLGLAGALLAAGGLAAAGPHYDAVLHGVFIGFVLSMVFAHAPIILPAVARLELPFSPTMYVALGVLHVGLVVRLLGDFLPHAALRRVGGLSTAVALLALGLAALWSRLRVSDRRPTP